MIVFYFFFFQAEDGIRDYKVTGVQTCALPISTRLLLRFPSRLRVTVTAANAAPCSDAVNFLDLMAPENPRQRQIKNRRTNDQPRENEQLYGKARVDRKGRVVVPEPASYAHNACAQRDLIWRWRGFSGA